MADVCSLRLESDSRSNLFKPMWNCGDDRSPIVDDFTEQDIIFFAEIVSAIPISSLQSRIADIVWIMQKPRNHEFARMAIKGYKSVSIDIENWHLEGESCWKRAITLAKQLGAKEEIEEMESTLIGIFNTASIEQQHYPLFLSEVMLEFSMDKNGNEIADRLCNLARAFQENGDFYTSRSYYEGAAKWYSSLDDEQKRIRMIVAEAETLVQDAESRMNSEKSAYIAAIPLLNNAIELYRSIPGTERSIHQVNERIEELRKKYQDAGRMSLFEMKEISTGKTDISEIVEHVRLSVKGKSVEEALLAFLNFYNFANEKSFRERALNQQRNAPLHKIFSSIRLSDQGRVVNKNPGLNPSSNGQLDDSQVFSAMMEEYNIRVGLVVQSCILPAWRIVTLEHRLSLNFFIQLVKQSPIVPRDRIMSFSKGLYAGYDWDFLSSLNLLVPQMESLVRAMFKQAGQITTTLIDGVDQEIGLSSLMERLEATEILGPDLAFEVRALFCDSEGANLRNEIAHGLASDSFFFSQFSIYGWWLIFKIVYNVYWNTYGESMQDAEKEKPDEA